MQERSLAYNYLLSVTKEVTFQHWKLLKQVQICSLPIMMVNTDQVQQTSMMLVMVYSLKKQLKLTLMEKMKKLQSYNLYNQLQRR